jgi:prepilin-type N-terminal cleavage/methylation domain-containing protein
VKHQRGFTLIELLCALTILAAVLAVSIRILSGSSRNAAASLDYQRALAVASAHLAEMQAAPHAVPGLRGGNDDGIDWQEDVRQEQGKAFADAEAAKLIAWRLRSVARSKAGRSVILTSVRLERPQ